MTTPPIFPPPDTATAWIKDGQQLTSLAEPEPPFTGGRKYTARRFDYQREDGNLTGWDEGISVEAAVFVRYFRSPRRGERPLQSLWASFKRPPLSELQEFLANNGRFGLVHASTIAAARHYAARLRRQYNARSVLVVTPACRLAKWVAGAWVGDWLFITPTTGAVTLPVSATNKGFDLIIADEPHKYKRYGRRVVDDFCNLSAPRRFALVSQPAENIAADLFYTLGWLAGCGSRAFPYRREWPEYYHDNLFFRNTHTKRRTRNISSVDKFTRLLAPFMPLDALK